MPYRWRDTLRIEAAAILSAVDRIDPSIYEEAVAILRTRQPILTGMGKSGLIAQKAASTFRSLGMPAHYLHPGDASHGDLGGVTGNSAVIALSHSGSTPELGDLLVYCRSHGIPIIAVTSSPHSALSEAARAALCYGPIEEACPMGLAPTASTAASLAICDALAIDLAEARGVSPEVFSRYHPGGKLGAILRKAKDVMREPLPVVGRKSTLMETALVMTGEIAGVAIVVERGIFQGVVTDGDLRRAVNSSAPDVRAGDIMTADPLLVDEHTPIRECVRIMNERRITKLLVDDELGSVIGVVNLHDCT